MYDCVDVLICIDAVYVPVGVDDDDDDDGGEDNADAEDKCTATHRHHYIAIIDLISPAAVVDLTLICTNAILPLLPVLIVVIVDALLLFLLLHVIVDVKGCWSRAAAAAAANDGHL